MDENELESQDNPLYVPYLGLALALALVALILGHLVLFLFYYSDTLAPTTLPYYEQFTDVERLDYRHYEGTWRVENEVLVQTDTSLADLYAILPGLTVDPADSYYFSARTRILAGPKGAGLLFNMQQPDDVIGSHLVRFGTDNGQDYVVYGYFVEEEGRRVFIAQGSVPPEIGEEAELGVAIHDGVYDLFVDGRRVAAGIPLEYEGGQLALTTWFSSVAFDDVYAADAVLPAAVGEPAPVQPEEPAQAVAASAEAPADVPDVVPADPVVQATEVRQIAGLSEIGRMLQLLPYGDGPTVADPFAEVGALNSYFDNEFSATTDQSRWRVLSGDWRLGPDGLVQLNDSNFDNAIVHAGQFSDYVMRTRFQHLESIGGGVLFNMPPGSMAKSGHLVRYMEDGILAWGYFDEEGVFQGQGAANVPADGRDIHTLEIASGAETYEITLDGITVARNIPLALDQGRIGLTASQSVVAFKEVAIAALDGFEGSVDTAQQVVDDEDEAEAADAPEETSQDAEVEINP